MKIDYIVSNPPYGDAYCSCLDIKVVNRSNEFCNKQISIFPITRIQSKPRFKRKCLDSGHLRSIDIVNANKLFNISTCWRFAGIYYFDNENIYPKIICNKDNISKQIDVGYEACYNYYQDYVRHPKDFVKIFYKYKPVYDYLINTYGNLTEEKPGWRYLKLYGDSAKEYSKDFKFYLYTTCWTHAYDKIKRGPLEKFSTGHYFFTNKQNIINNLEYYLKSPQYNLFRRYYFEEAMDAAKYKIVPSQDFDVPEEDFKNYIDNLIKFTHEELNILKNYKAII